MDICKKHHAFQSSSALKIEMCEHHRQRLLASKSHLSHLTLSHLGLKKPMLVTTIEMMVISAAFYWEKHQK